MHNDREITTQPLVPDLQCLQTYSCQFHFMLEPISLAVNFPTRTGEGLAATLKGLGAL